MQIKHVDIKDIPTTRIFEDLQLNIVQLEYSTKKVYSIIFSDDKIILFNYLSM